MIAVDTSALMTILLREPKAHACKEALASDDTILVSAGTLSEAVVVASTRNISGELFDLVERLHLQVVPVTEASARRIGEAYANWGKGVHPAGLNFGDCFSYEVAKQNACPLLYVGNDFSKTDVKSVL